MSYPSSRGAASYLQLSILFINPTPRHPANKHLAPSSLQYSKVFQTNMSEFTLPNRPAALPVSKTCFYKIVNGISIPIDIYLPPSPTKSPLPIMLFIHGGGWVGGDRLDYPRATFHRFLSLGFIVASMEYRLLPETPLFGQLEDIRDVEPWLRTKLRFELKADGVEVDAENIVVVGASAGAHLALLTVRIQSFPQYTFP
jgi:acetyl esterase/lipase